MKNISVIVLMSLVFLSNSATSLTHTVKRNLKRISFETFYQKLNGSGISMSSFKHGYCGYSKICDSLKTNLRYLCIADFEKPSSEKRLFVIDMLDTTIAHIDYVAHGRNTGMLFAESFSNEPNSFQSSLGFYLVSESYQGKHGLSLKLDGLDADFNLNARKRAIVIHAADYATPQFISTNGRMGRSQGCPAMSPECFQKVAPLITQKSVLFIYYPEKRFINQSIWLAYK